MRCEGRKSCRSGYRYTSRSGWRAQPSLRSTRKPANTVSMAGRPPPHQPYARVSLDSTRDSHKQCACAHDGQNLPTTCQSNIYMSFSAGWSARRSPHKTQSPHCSHSKEAWSHLNKECWGAGQVLVSSRERTPPSLAGGSDSNSLDVRC